MFGRNVMPTNGRPEAQTEGVVQSTQATAWYNIHKVMEAWEIGLIAEAARRFSQTKILIAKTVDSRPIDAKSVINLSTMQIIGPANIIVYTVGPDAEKAAQEICKCIEGMSNTRKSAMKQST